LIRQGFENIFSICRPLENLHLVNTIIHNFDDENKDDFKTLLDGLRIKSPIQYYEKIDLIKNFINDYENNMKEEKKPIKLDFSLKNIDENPYTNYYEIASSYTYGFGAITGMVIGIFVPFASVPVIGATLLTKYFLSQKGQHITSEKDKKEEKNKLIKEGMKKELELFQINVGRMNLIKLSKLQKELIQLKEEYKKINNDIINEKEDRLQILISQIEFLQSIVLNNEEEIIDTNNNLLISLTENIKEIKIKSEDENKEIKELKEDEKKIIDK
jgi:hypothetical protein